MHESGHELGKRFSLLMDNTNADNKCAMMVCFIGWLVQMDYFEDASFFCMLKGHTFTVLDQSFNTMISQLLAIAIYTLSHLMELVFQFLQPYGCRQVVELHQLWDWKAAFAPHTTKIQGFCTSQYGSGMHECYVRKDKNGEYAALCTVLPRSHFSTNTLLVQVLSVHGSASRRAQRRGSQRALA